MDTLLALRLLAKCRGDEIWSDEHCRQSGVPETWISELSDGYESGFDNDSNTIYVGESVTNQYAGVRDLDLAYRLAETLGCCCAAIRAQFSDRRNQVRAIQELVDEEV